MDARPTLDRLVVGLATEQTWGLAAIVASLLFALGLVLRRRPSGRAHVAGSVLAPTAAVALLALVPLTLGARHLRRTARPGVIVVDEVYLADEDGKSRGGDPIPRPPPSKRANVTVVSCTCAGAPHRAGSAGERPSDRPGHHALSARGPLALAPARSSDCASVALVWVRRAAIRPVAPYAQLRSARSRTSRTSSVKTTSKRASASTRPSPASEETQPALADRISNILNGPLDETALALGYFLTLAIWLGFDGTFGSEMTEVTETALVGVEESLQLDEQIRLSDPAEAVDSDDVVAMEQPDILSFVHEHLDAALEANAGEVDVSDVHSIYRVVLVEVLALSYAVKAPANWAMPTVEFTA